MPILFKIFATVFICSSGHVFFVILTTRTDRMIDQLTIEKILDAANIVDVVSEFVTLRKRGVNYVGLCPFHNEKTPSFYVSPSKGICKCFSCGKAATPSTSLWNMSRCHSRMRPNGWPTNTAYRSASVN